METFFKFISIFALISQIACTQTIKKENFNNTKKEIKNMKLELATFGGGCFWCTEAIFQSLNGVEKVESGYEGGHVENPTYEQVCTKTTGHAEVIQIQYDPEKISFQDLVEIFFDVHDPTTINQQGEDKGPQYRSVIFYHSDTQKAIANQVITEYNLKTKFVNPIVTEVTEHSKFWKAEGYHQNYFNNNSNQPYCNVVVSPKVQKFKKKYSDKLK